MPPTAPVSAVLNRRALRGDDVVAPVPAMRLETWEALVDRALAAGASDLHARVVESGPTQVRARIDGVLQPWGLVAADVMAPAMVRMKASADMSTARTLLVDEGRYSHETADGRQVDLRLTLTPLVGRVTKVTLRLPSVDANLTMDGLGFSDTNAVLVCELLESPDGMVVAAGPTGAGKSTTLFAALQYVGGTGRSVVTVEDPVERVVVGADQIEVNDEAGFTYGHILRSLLRMDLDVLLVGEVRDVETARHAIQIAKAGRLVLSSLHAGNAVTALLRLRELSAGLGPLVVLESVRGVVAQRLVRRTHLECAGHGCEACFGTGFYGRVPIHEVLRVSDDLIDTVLAGAPRHRLYQVAQSTGLVPFHNDVTRLLDQGLTTRHEIRRVLGHD